MVRVRAAQQRRARRQLGQPRQQDAELGAQELRRGARAGRADGRGQRAPRCDRGGLRDRRRSDRVRALPGRARRGDEARNARQPLHGPPGAVGTDRDRPRAGRNRALRRAARDRQPEDGLRAVPAVLVPGGARAARQRGDDRRAARAARGRRRRRPARGADGRLRVVDREAWAPSELAPGQALQKPRPLFKKLDPDVVVADELARMQARAADSE